MKTLKKFTIYFWLVIGIFAITPIKQASAQNFGVSFQVFYDELAPYGQWVQDYDYGYIWVPNVGPDFQPYGSNGYWTQTNYGNTWVSNYAWGWAPFHYGRWNYSNYYGWSWIPGYEWAPAWVNWRSGGGYYGWAPLGPSQGIHVSVNIPDFYWVFMPSRYITNRNIDRYYVRHERRNQVYNNTTIINNTQIINNNYYVSGPTRSEMERATGRKVNVREVRGSDRPGTTRVSSRELSIYRPDIQQNTSSSARPSQIVTRDQARENRLNTTTRS